MLTDSVDYTVNLWDAETGQLLRTFSMGKYVPLNTSIFSPDGSKILTGAYTSATLWDSNTGNIIHQFRHASPAFSVAVSLDESMIMTGNEDQTAILWNTKTGEIIKKYTGNSVYSVAFSPDCKTVLIGNHDAAQLWDIATGKAIRSYPGESINTVMFSPDGSKILISGYRIMKLYDTKTGLVLCNFPGHEYLNMSAAFSPDGSKAATGTTYQTTKIWDTETGQMIHKFSGGSGTVRFIAFTPDGSKVLIGGWDAIAKLMDVKTGYVSRIFYRTYAGYLFRSRFPGWIKNPDREPGSHRETLGYKYRSGHLYDNGTFGYDFICSIFTRWEKIVDRMRRSYRETLGCGEWARDLHL